MLNINKILEQCGRTLESIGKSAGIPVERLKEAQADDSWNMLEVSRIAKVLNVAIEDLLLEPSAAEYLAFQFRAPTAKPRRSVPDFEIAKLNRYVSSAFRILDQSPPQIWFSAQGEELNSPELLAKKFRQTFYPQNPIGPIIDLPMLCAEKLGCLVYTINSAHIDGASAFVDQRPFIFISRRFTARMLFTLAHELGHLFKRSADPEQISFIDEDIFQTRGPEEKFANNFASCVLMPEAGILITIKEYRKKAGIQDTQLGDIEIIVLSHLFGVSFEAAALRCEALGLLPPGGSDALASKVKEEHGSAEKRTKAEGLPDRPNPDFPLVSPELLRSAARKVRAGQLSLGDAVSVLGVGARDIFTAAGKDR